MTRVRARRAAVVGLSGAVIVFGAVAWSACYYADWSLDTPSEDASQEHPVDSQTSGPDASLEGSPGADAATEDTAKDGGLTWCQTQGKHSFCADFDEGQAALGWTTEVLSTSGSIKLDGAFFQSPPDALLTTLPSGANVTALYEKIFSTSETTWAFAFDVRIDSIDAGTGGGDYGFARIWGASQSRITLHTNGVTVWMDQDIPTVDAGSFSTHPVNVAPPVGTWQRFEIKASFAGSTHTVDVLAGVPGVNVCTFNLESSFAKGSPEFDLGIETFGSGLEGSAMRYDDVLIDVTP
jgi:hypothetical protein